MLYIVSTPIGNLEDISIRAIEVLKKVNLIACEDTRKTKILLDRYEIKNEMISFHAQSNYSKENQIINMLKKGDDIALVSEAGTPGISDPGSGLIKTAVSEGIQITHISGSSAFLSALIISGFSLDRFTFLGFIPNKKGRNKFVGTVMDIPITVVFYESKHRILKCIEQMREVLKNRRIVIVREISKMFEERIELSTEEDLDKFVTTHNPKGEYVVVVDKVEK
jgi:16S rRNA (cytidine1402-2'-O)-methyltransferase